MDKEAKVMFGKLLLIGYFFGPLIVGVIACLILLILHLWWWAIGAIAIGCIGQWLWGKIWSSMMNPL